MPRRSASTARSIDCRSVSAADWVCDWGEGAQWPNERNPIFFMQDESTIRPGVVRRRSVKLAYAATPSQAKCVSPHRPQASRPSVFGRSPKFKEPSEKFVSEGRLALPCFRYGSL